MDRVNNIVEITKTPDTLDNQTSYKDTDIITIDKENYESSVYNYIKFIIPKHTSVEVEFTGDCLLPILLNYDFITVDNPVVLEDIGNRITLNYNQIGVSFIDILDPGSEFSIEDINSHDFDRGIMKRQKLDSQTKNQHAVVFCVAFKNQSKQLRFVLKTELNQVDVSGEEEYSFESNEDLQEMYQGNDITIVINDVTLMANYVRDFWISPYETLSFKLKDLHLHTQIKFNSQKDDILLDYIV